MKAFWAKWCKCMHTAHPITKRRTEIQTPKSAKGHSAQTSTARQMLIIINVRYFQINNAEITKTT
jgi:hypothetical protein